ncbi:glucan 1,4-alpha-glucosidase [Natronolimnobius sp. AArcel1]|uniref:glycoside hydrolase family 15 protein n=1 Tax=Natronolimnobius sp. AArcel1 TaxID=1679093 RepID=UPI0013E9E6D2|nr:glycoside hydrolase family 15 protein [Natronolimnobius sp. AArcel1]NGM71127.1 glucan 1,4-alpha-glucosidase [Natronolimnobius sp. AArcel1]
MQLRDAVDDYKRHASATTRFPGERRTTGGRFSGGSGRLVHVRPNGRLRDFGYPLTSLNGIARSRFGLEGPDGEIIWSDSFESEQHYLEDTTVVRTRQETPFGRLVRDDLTIGDGHLTQFELESDGIDSDEIALVTSVGFAPDGQDDRVGQLRFDNTVELYHRTEHDFLASATGITDLHGVTQPDPEDVLEDEPTDTTAARDGDRYEEARLSGTVVTTIPFQDGSAAIATLLTDSDATDRDTARATLEELLAIESTADALREASSSAIPSVPTTVPNHEQVAADLRVLSLLSAESGLRIAGPDFDPYYYHSGGYGYTWFRDDAEISRFLLEAGEQLDLDLESWHRRSAEMYCQTQRADGSWPHRVWPVDGSLAPGWANGRLETGDGTEYQADQTGSVIAFLAMVADREMEISGLEDTLEPALASLDETLEDDGRPTCCQNAWEDTSGRFIHTAATFLEAYTALAAAGLEDACSDERLPDDTTLSAHASAQAARVVDAIDDLWLQDDYYAVRERPDGTIDERVDSATLALVSAHRAYDSFARAEMGSGLSTQRLDRLVSHVDTCLERLRHDPAESDVDGLIRYEGDEWRQRGQGHEKIWTVSTAWGANACAELTALLQAHDDPRAERFAATTEELLDLVALEGPLCAETSYLPEQFFDDGTPDSATPLGWPHALRLATTALLEEQLGSADNTQ